MDTKKLFNSLSANEKYELYTLLVKFYSNAPEFPIKEIVRQKILSNRANNLILTYSRVYNIEFITDIDKYKLSRLRNCGKTSYNEIVDFINILKQQ